MQVTQASQAAYNNLDLSIQTSSGDSISLNMYNNKEMEYSDVRSGNTRIQEFSLSHEYGYKFSYEGNGIDKQDMKEIREALKDLRPAIKDYMQNAKDDGMPSPRAIINESLKMRQELPSPQDFNHKQMMADELLNTFNDELKNFAPDTKVLEATKSLFDRLYEQLDSFSLYA